METFGHLLFALLYLGLAALPFLLVLCVLHCVGTAIGRGMADGLQQARAPRRLVFAVPPEDDRSPRGLVWPLVWLAAGVLVVLALAAG
jgi:hypothetical protein